MAETNTTHQLTAPSGKTTSDFGGGKLTEDNPGSAVDLSANQYREDEFVIAANSLGVTGETYQFRVVLDGMVIPATYTVIPELTITATSAGYSYGIIF